MSLTAQGYTRRRLPDIKADLEEAFKSEFGNDISLEPSEPLGQLIGVLAQPLSDIEEGMEAIYNSQYPDSAEGISLDRVSHLAGVSRLPATKTVVDAVVTGSQGTVISSGQKARLKENGTEFEMSSSVTIDRTAALRVLISVDTVENSSGYSVTINGTAYSITSGTAATAQDIITALLTELEAQIAPVIGLDNSDETMTLTTEDYETALSFLVSSNLSIDSITCYAEFTALDAGKTHVPENTLTEIVTPVSGWDSVDNWFVSQTGRDEETDPELRTRRQGSLHVLGSGNTEALRAQLLQNVENVTSVHIIENRTDDTVGGRPPHSYECVVTGGDEQDIAEMIWSKGSPLQTVGDITRTVIDSQGYEQEINFSRAANIYIWLQITLTLNSEEQFPADGNTQVVTYALNYGETYQSNGKDVIMERLKGYINLNVPGIKSMVIQIATSSTPEGPAGTYGTGDLAIGDTEIAIFAEDRTIVS